MTKANTPHKHLDGKWKTMAPTTHVDAALRHLYAWLGGEERDPELGTSHLANAATRLLMGVSQEADAKALGDDRARYTHAEEAPLPAPVNEELESYHKGELPLDSQMAKVGDVVSRNGENPITVLYISDHFASGRGILSGLITHHPHGTYTIHGKEPQRSIDSIKPSEWDAANTSFLAAKKTLDDCTGQEWNAASAAYYAKRKAALTRYDIAVGKQKEGDEE